MNKPGKPISIRQTTFNQDRDSIKYVRQQVFINEQHVPVELEWDEHDRDAIHLVVFDTNHKPVATSRILRDGHIGRMAVLPAWRRQGIGTSMLLQLIAIAKQQGFNSVFLSAQVEAIDFYRKQGFNISSETYMDAGIPHKDMKLNISGLNTD